MPGADRSRLLAIAVELEARDERLAAELEVVADLSHRLASLRERVRDAAGALARVPRELARIDGTLAEIDALLEAARAVAEGAEAAAEHGGTEEQRLAVTEGRSALRSLEERRDHVSGLRAGLAGQERRARDELRDLERDAAALAALMAEAPRLADVGRPPGAGVDGIGAWAEPAQAALLLSRSSLEEERQRVVREAAELAAAALGDPVELGSVGRVRRRLERELA